MEAAVPSFAHIKASMAPILVSLTYPNSDASDPNIDAFREDNWFAADVQRTSKRRHCQEQNKRKSKHSILLDNLLGLERSPSRCLVKCTLGTPKSV